MSPGPTMSISIGTPSPPPLPLEGKTFPRLTRSTIEVAHFRYFVSERRGSLPPKRLNVTILISIKTFSRLGPWDYSPRCISIFSEVGFRVRSGAP